MRQTEMYKIDIVEPRLANCDYIKSVKTIDGSRTEIEFYNSKTKKSFRLKSSPKCFNINGDFIFLRFKLKGDYLEVIGIKERENDTVFFSKEKFKQIWNKLDKSTKKVMSGDYE